MSEAPLQPTIANPQRFHGFDALRGGAMLLGIVLHAAITYMDRRMDGLLWPLSDQPTSHGFDLLFWWIHGWRIPLFFVMAGFFAAMLARRRGPGGFIKHRIDRILYPVIVATLTLLPAMFYLWAWGWVLQGRADIGEVMAIKFRDPAIQDYFLGPAHLWFLNYLFLFSLLYWLILKWRRDRAGETEPTLNRTSKRIFTSALRPVFFALPTFVLLTIDLDFYLEYHHIFPRTVPEAFGNLAQLVYQGYFFAVGIYLFRLHREMQPFKRFALVYLVAAHVAFLFGMLMLARINAMIDEGGEVELATRVGLAGAIALYCWFMIWGLTGLGLTVLAAPRSVVRWLSDSAYWVYLVHLPIVALLMIVMRDWAIGPWLRFAMIVAATSALTLASYQWGVRYTVIGRWLNGPRSRPGGG